MLLPDSAERLELLQQTGKLIDEYYQQLETLPVAPKVRSSEIRQFLQDYDFEQSHDLKQVLDTTYRALRDWGMKVAHPGYYGLFNPAPSYAGVLADLLAAALNPQAGAWHHQPFGVEMERHVIKYFAGRFGLPVETAYGNFTTGGSEANSTGVLLALTRQLPEFTRRGLRAAAGQPVFYCSEEFHHSFEKIAHSCGLGRDAVRTIATDSDFRMIVSQLEQAINRDRELGHLPFMVVATAGTTNAGIIDPLAEIAAVCRQQQLHLHVDAAWGGAVILSDKLKSCLAGIEHADTITFDAHKLLSVPMAAGLLISREARWLADTFHVETAYVPESSEVGMDNYRLSLQFSRRLIGLKLFMTLASAGRQGYAETIEHQVAMAEYLAGRLVQHDWRLAIAPSLAIVCFADQQAGALASEQLAAHQAAIVAAVVDSGRAWISVTRIAGQPVIRVCVTSYLTRRRHVDELLQLLNQARAGLAVQG